MAKVDDMEFLRRAYREAWKSKDQSVQNGAILVCPSTLMVLAAGHNNILPGIEDRPERRERPAKYAWTEHAERWSIYDAASKGVPTFGLWMYACWASCADCARAIVAAGIKVVVAHDAPFHRERTDWAESIAVGDQMFREAGVELIRLPGRLGMSVLFNGEIVEA